MQFSLNEHHIQYQYTESYQGGQDLPILYYTRAYKSCFVSFCSRTDRGVEARRRKEYPEHGKCETGGETVGCKGIMEKVDEGT